MRKKTYHKCRKCKKNFTYFGDLLNHLNIYPSHKKRFIKNKAKKMGRYQKKVNKRIKKGKNIGWGA